MPSVFDPNHQQNSLSSKITVGLERISEAFKVLLWDYAKTRGLSPIQVQILIFVAYHSTELSTVSALAREFNLTKPTVSDAVKTLMLKDLLHKKASPSDSRSFTLHLSAEGKRTVDQAANFANPITQELNSMDPAGLESMYKNLTQLIYKLNRAGILTVQRTCRACRFHEEKEGGHYCNFLQSPLAERDIRLDCPEFEKA